MRHYLVFDAGGTFTKYALVDENAVILEKNQVPTPSYEEHDKEDYYQMLDFIVEEYRNQISGIAISMPGILDSKRGYAVTAGYLDYLSGSNVAQELGTRYGLPVSIENDGKCAALAEYWQGSLKECKNAAVMILGTGVAGGLIVDGKLYRGNHFSAGEYSFTYTKGNLPMEEKGFWGMSGGVSGLCRQVAKHTGEDAAKYDGKAVFELVNAGNKQALAGLEDYTDELAVQIYNLNILLDLDKVAIGGGISQQPVLLEYIEKSLNKIMEQHPLKHINPYIPVPAITNCKFYNDANIIGALYRFRQIVQN